MQLACILTNNLYVFAYNEFFYPNLLDSKRLNNTFPVDTFTVAVA